MEKMLRNVFLFLSKNKVLTILAKKYGLRFGASRFVAGETVQQVISVMKDLESQGLVATIDYLGEFVNNENEAIEMADHVIETIEAISKENLNAQVSLKLTSMGLDISDELVMNNMRRIMESASEGNVFVTIDMEDYSRCEKTLAIFRELKRNYENIGTVLQAYLYRTVDDLQDLNELSPNLRLVKGAYKESAEVAFPVKKDVDENFEKLIKMHLENGNYTAIATHDDAIINYTKKLVNVLNVSTEQFEFQMLYGIRSEKQIELVQEGYPMRIYIPYGTDWYGYYMRRLAERPANIVFLLKNMLKR